jgi:hypothetical protein
VLSGVSPAAGGRIRAVGIEGVIVVEDAAAELVLIPAEEQAGTGVEGPASTPAEEWVLAVAGVEPGELRVAAGAEVAGWVEAADVPAAEDVAGVGWACSPVGWDGLEADWVCCPVVQGEPEAG